MLTNLFYVFMSGGLGSVCRFAISMIVTTCYSKSVFPLATFVSNILSCLVLVITMYLVKEKLGTEMPLRLLIVTGFCGGFSTFSAFSFETVELMKSGNYTYAVINICVSVLSGIAIIYLLNRTAA